MASVQLRVQHNSLQFSDPRPQQRHDVKKIFETGGRFPIKTGTEASLGKGNDNREFLKEFAEKFDHVINFGSDCWVAVDKTIIHPKSVEMGDLFLADARTMKTPGGDRVMPWIGFDHVDERVGRIYQGAVHYPLKGAKKGSPNYMVNTMSTLKIGEWLAKVAAGRNIGFVNGDFNMNDRILDVALGQKFTSMADELNRHQNTGHGPIDGICSYDRDGRVSPRWFNVLDDEEFHLYSDHYTCRGSWDINVREAE